MRVDTMILNEKHNATLTAYIQAVDGEFMFKKRPGILVIPGGGYQMCSDREADPVALAYARAGYQTFILRYAVGSQMEWPMPLDDYEAAMEVIGQHAEEWHLDAQRIAVVGFSAGGHLAACAATIAQHKPTAAVLVYPAILSEVLELCKAGLPCPNEMVDQNTCPCFLVAARDDRTVDVKNTLMMELALIEQGISFESHIYSYGGHDFSTEEDWIQLSVVTDRMSRWVEDSVGWLSEVMGRLMPSGISEPDMAICLNSDNAPVLSVMCSFAYLQSQSEEVQTMLKPIYDGITEISKLRGLRAERVHAALHSNTLKEILEMLQVDEQEVIALDQQLHKIVNKQN